MIEPEPPVRLTHLVKSAGCAAKIGPAKLRHVLGALTLPIDKDLLVGLATGDDAGVYRLSGDVALVQTVDFFPPIVDDPYLFGQIAAANALSDVYAMGGKPLTAMNIVCFPIEAHGPALLEAILRGGADKVAEAGALLVGGHSVEDAEPKYGLSVTGVIHPDHVASNAGARPGDRIVLTKPLGTGIVTTAAKFDSCEPEVLDAATRSMATLNAAAAEAVRAVGIGPDLPVHAMTDVTGFSLLGHLYHLARASGVGIEIESAALPLLPEVERLADAGCTTRGGKENAAYLSNYLEVDARVAAGLQSVMLDPQTSGGLAICVAEDGLPRLLDELETRGALARAVIGRVVAGDPGIRVY
ncbi:MAG TPA: selenide, water dikinase SelD [Chthonomonadaceae bacterium]|nr:selenide, water dikinase SelD [Chthonomonadaceae bacterium]